MKEGYFITKTLISANIIISIIFWGFQLERGNFTMTNLLDFVASLFCDQRLSNCPPFLIQLNQTPRIPSLQLPLDLILDDPDPNFDIGSCLCNDQIYPHNDLTDH